MGVRKKIKIIGGGFAGVKCALTLRKKLKRDEADIILYNSENYLVFQPLLAEVVGASISPEPVAVPLRQMLPGIYCRTEEISNINVEYNYVEYLDDRGRKGQMGYDHLVIACGSSVNLGQIPGMADHAYPLKTVGDAVALRHHVMQQMENAEISEDVYRRRWHLSFIIVGGGFSGVEVAGEINDLVRDTRKFYRNIPKEEIKVTLIHSRDQLLPEVSSKLRDFTRKKMEQAGINVVLNRRVSHVTRAGVSFDDGVSIDGATIVCTVGNATAPVIQRLNAPKERGRLITDPDMRVQGYKNVWAVGDCALIDNSYDNTRSPATGQFAERQGRQTALNIARVINGKETKPFYFRPLGQLCAIGGHNAVAEFLGFHISGFLAWFLWRSVYLFKLPSFSHKLKVGFDWAWEIFYSRDLAHPRANLTERVGRSHFQAGDYIFREGDPTNDFYIIESGEVEVVKNADKKDEKVLAILGAGDFFGEMALLDKRARSSSVRARTELEVTIMGKKVFEQISGALKPFKDFIADAVKRRSGNFWQKLPVVYKLLENQPVSAFIEPVDNNKLSPNDTFETAVKTLCDKQLEICFVVDSSNRLTGVLTRTDIFRALESTVTPHTTVSEFMIYSPMVITDTDSATAVAETMRDHNLKWVPVVDNLSNMYLKGYVRRDKMINYVLDKLHSQDENASSS